MSFWLICLLLTNGVAFALFGIDKHRAVRSAWRVSEFTLLLTALVGGSLGALAGMYFFHHKTRKPLFFIGVPLFLVVHVLILLAALTAG
ncbi:MAG: DUF1294 domain-containing protein [Paludibacteraceae bacterium]|nr:DUF1294 domain-containing protein [Paludibacteraceae bacterium]